MPVKYLWAAAFGRPAEEQDPRFYDPVCVSARIQLDDGRYGTITSHGKSVATGEPIFGVKLDDGTFHYVRQTRLRELPFHERTGRCPEF